MAELGRLPAPVPGDGCGAPRWRQAAYVKESHPVSHPRRQQGEVFELTVEPIGEETRWQERTASCGRRRALRSRFDEASGPPDERALRAQVVRTKRRWLVKRGTGPRRWPGIGHIKWPVWCSPCRSGGNYAARSPDPGAARVLIVSCYVSPHVGGVEVIVGQLASSLTELGHEVTVVTSACGPGPQYDSVEGYKVVRVRAWNGLEDRSAVPFPVWSPTAVWTLYKLMREADVVHVHDVLYVSSFLAAVLAKLWRRPVFVTQHVAVVNHRRALVGLAQRSVYWSVGRLLWRWAVTITVYNPIVESFLVGHGVPAEKVKLAYNGVDTKEFCPAGTGRTTVVRERYGLPIGTPLVLFVGRLVPKKGFERVSRGPRTRVRGRTGGTR